jgi:hypothetical protein
MTSETYTPISHQKYTIQTIVNHTAKSKEANFTQTRGDTRADTV